MTTPPLVKMVKTAGQKTHNRVNGSAMVRAGGGGGGGGGGGHGVTLLTFIMDL